VDAGVSEEDSGMADLSDSMVNSNGPVELDRAFTITPTIRCNSTQLSQRVSPVQNILSAVESDRRSDHSTRSDSTQLGQLSWIGLYDSSYDPVQLN
jgi:hypothetical protein